MFRSTLPLPPHYDPATVAEVWRVPYEELARAAKAWAREHGIPPAGEDTTRVGLLVVDAQNTFCMPGFELFVGGRSGRGAVEDMDRLCRFLYRNLAAVTRVIVTMDTHEAAQIFHAAFLVNEAGEHPAPMTMVSAEDVRQGRWRANPALAEALGRSPEQLQAHLEHYVSELERQSRLTLTIWPYHAMLGGIGHALVPAVEAACFFHAMARDSPTRFEVKGRNPLTENYSVLSPEVLTTPAPGGAAAELAQRNRDLIDHLLSYDRLYVAGEAKSHCVAWTLEDLLEEIQARDPSLASRVHILEDCMSPVCVPNVVDFTEAADAALERFQQAGMRVVRSTDPL